MRCSAAFGFGPVVAPHTAIAPADAAAWSDRVHVASPTSSTTTSTPRPPVASFTASTASSCETATSAPSSRARSSFAADDEVTTTRAPSALAIASDAVATPPPIPQISTHSPSRSPARVTSIRYDVSNTSGNAAASSNESDSSSG